MKGDKIGEFEEFALLAVSALTGEPYGAAILQVMEAHTKRHVTLGAVYAALTRLETKGYVASALGEATPVRGGKARRFYTVTREGRNALRDLRRIREGMWQAIESGGRP
jgi:DNA-binding PadR family transcriptional regulator